MSNRDYPLGFCIIVWVKPRNQGHLIISFCNLIVLFFIGIHIYPEQLPLDFFWIQKNPFQVQNFNQQATTVHL